MAQYEISRACGHTETVDITGSNTKGGHDHRCRQESQRRCHACRQAQNAATNASAARVAAETDLAALIGTEKQVAWAQTLRLAGLAEIADGAAQLLGARYPAAVDTLAATCTRIALTHTEAAWWIDNRGYIFSAVRREMTTADKLAVQEAAK